MEFQTFGEWLRHQRLKKEISPFRMAEDLGYKRVSAIYNFEYGIAPLPLSKWPTLARILQLPFSDFLTVMKRYFPEKAAEFRMIQKTAPQKVVGRNRAPQTVFDFSFTPTGGVPVNENALRNFQAVDAEWVLVTQEDWEDSLILSVDRLRGSEGLKVGLLQVPGTPFSAPDVVKNLKDTRGVCVLEGSDKPGLTDRLKASFIDALTGAEGYPELHRVPRIFSISGANEVSDWTPPLVLELIKNIKENVSARHFSLGTKRLPLSSMKTVDKLEGAGL